MSKSSITTKAIAPNRVTAHPGEVQDEEFLKLLGMSVDAWRFNHDQHPQLYCSLTKTNRHAETQGSTIEISRSAKCRMFRVANVACRASAMPAIWVSRMSTDLPLFCRAAASDAASAAAALSKSKTRFSKSSRRSRSNSDSSFCRRRPEGSSARPKRASNNVMLVIQIDSAGCRSSHLTTAASGTARISAPRTLVSMMITW